MASLEQLTIDVAALKAWQDEVDAKKESGTQIGLIQDPDHILVIKNGVVTRVLGTAVIAEIQGTKYVLKHPDGTVMLKMTP